MTTGIYTVDAYGRYRFLADRERADADLLSLLGRVVRDAESFEDAGRQIEAVAEAKRAGAEALAEMAAERLQNSPDGAGE